jgi:hypothetical protein
MQLQAGDVGGGRNINLVFNAVLAMPAANLMLTALSRDGGNLVCKAVLILA